MPAGTSGRSALPCCAVVKTAKSLPVPTALALVARVRSGRSPDRPLQTKRLFMTRLRHLILAALLLCAAGPALAAEVTYPTGVRVGLTPLVGLIRAKTFSG